MLRKTILALGVFLATACGSNESERPDTTMQIGDSGHEVDKVYKYLKKYGYVSALSPEHGFTYDKNLEVAVSEFQKKNKLAVTGKVDSKTIALIDTPRCGYRDDESNSFVRFPTKWGKNRLTYRFINRTARLTNIQVDSAIASAARTWQQVTNINFTMTTASSSDITIRWFTRGNAPSGYTDFDGRNGVLARAWSPSDGRLAFDDDEQWTAGNSFPSTGTDLESVALHEFGHLIGLNHSDDPNSIMNPYYPYGSKRRKLLADDIAGIQGVYGVRPISLGLYTFNYDLYTYYPDLAGMTFDQAFSHWRAFGVHEGRASSPIFDVNFYLGDNGDLVDAFGEYGYRLALEHFVNNGLNEGRAGSPVFDVKYYLNHNADLQAAYGSTNYQAALTHFVRYGIDEGRQGSPQFNPVFYLNSNRDVAAEYGDTNYSAAIMHWLIYGRSEGRRGIP